MRLVLLTLYFTAFVCTTAFSQSRKIDSLSTILQSEKNEVNQAHLFLELAKEYSNFDSDQADIYLKKIIPIAERESLDSLLFETYNNIFGLKYSKSSLTILKDYVTKMDGLANEINNGQITAKLNLRQGSLLKKEMKLEEAILYYDKAIQYYQTTADQKNEGIALYRKAMIIYGLKKYDAAEEICNKAITIHKNLNENSLAGRDLTLKSDIFFKKGDRKQALVYAEEAIDILQKTNKKKSLANAYNKAGKLARRLGENEKAIHYHKTCIDLAESIDSVLLGRATHSLGLVYRNQGKVDTAEMHFEKSLEIAQKIKNNRSIMNIAGALGSLKKRQGEHDKSREYYQLYFEMAKKLKNPTDIALGHYFLAESSFLLEDYDEFLARQKKALSIYEEYNEVNRIPFVYGRIADYYYSVKKDYPNALVFIDKAIKANEKINDQNGIAGNLGRKAGVFRNQKKYNEAIELYKKQLSLATQSEHKRMIGIASNGIVTTILQMEEENPGAFKESFHNINFNQLEQQLLYELESQKESKDYRNQMAIIRNLSKYYNFRGQFEQAYFFQKEYNNLQDSIFTKDKTDALTEMETKYSTEQKEKENLLLQAQNTTIQAKNRTYQIGGSLLLLLIGLGAYFLLQINKAKNQLQLQNETIQKQNQQLTDLNRTKDRFFSIIAHDLRSPITAFQGIGKQIRYYLKKENTTKLEQLGTTIENTSGKLNTLLDNLLSWSLLQTGKIPYHPNSLFLNDTVEEVLDIFNSAAMTKNIQLISEVDDDIQVHADEAALNTIVRNLVSNAIKFTPEEGTVLVQADEQSEQVFIKINDTGTGISADKLQKIFSVNKKSIRGTKGEKGTGLGLMLCKELVEMNKGFIKVESKEGKGSSFIFSLPKK